MSWAASSSPTCRCPSATRSERPGSAKAYPAPGRASTLERVERPAERIDRVERVTNLLLALLDAEVPLTLDEIVHTVGGYPAGHDAYRQAFERDKRLLREQGITVSVEPVPGSEAVGYRIRPEDYYLPDLGLTPEENRSLNLALAAVAMDEAGGLGAAWKLGVAESLRSVQSAPIAALPSAPALPVLHEALRSRRAVRFSHRGVPRSVDPYGLLFRSGFWYVVGQDHDRRAIRCFRVDRIDGLPVVTGTEPFERPAGFDSAAALPEEAWSMGEGEALTAQVRVDPLHAGMVEAELGPGSVATRLQDGSIEVELQVVNRAAFRSWVLGLLDHAVVLGPDQLRQDLTDWLQGLASGA